jgi:hypothetical protein
MSGGCDDLALFYRVNTRLIQRDQMQLRLAKLR